MADAGSQPPKPDDSGLRMVFIDPVALAKARAGASKRKAPAADVPPPPAAFKPQPAALPPGSLEFLLHALLREHGARVYEERRLFRSFMADALAGHLDEHQLAVNTMALLVEEGLPARLIAVQPAQLATLLQHEADRVARQHGTRLEIVVEAVRCWATALRPELGRFIAAKPKLAPALAPASLPAATPPPVPPARPASHRITPPAAPVAVTIIKPSVPPPAPAQPGWSRNQIIAVVVGVVAVIWFLNRPGGTPPGGSGSGAPTPQPPPVTPPVTPPAVVAGSQVRASKDNPWVNTLGMRFVPVPGTEVLFSVWHTRVQDYQAFASATGRAWDKPSFAQGPTHPAVNVSWDDAQAFVKWLTQKERGEGRLTAGQSYRLPADWEWSVAVGLNEARAGSPQDKDRKITGAYPWGGQFPPPRGAGNYSQTLKVDDFKFTSPVGSFTANAFGLFDMGGNAWQWCEDLYSSSDTARVLRGGSSDSDDAGRLLSSFRGDGTPGLRDYFIGFRVVMVVGSSR